MMESNSGTYLGFSLKSLDQKNTVNGNKNSQGTAIFIMFQKGT